VGLRPHIKFKENKMGSYKGDIQATRIGAATSNVIIAPPVRLRGIIIAGLATSGLVELKTTSATGATLFHSVTYLLET
jgi:hypothetical protein